MRVFSVGVFAFLGLQISFLSNAGVVKLNGEFTAQEGDVRQYAVSPDNNWIVYRADQDRDEQYELYSVPVQGGPITKLNIPLSSAQGVREYAISSDSSRVVYLIYRSSAWVANELYSVPLGGGVSVKLNSVTSGEIRSFIISSDSTCVIYRSEQEKNEMFQIYRVPLTGGTAIKLNDTLIEKGSVHEFAVTPDSSRVIYVGDQNVDWQDEVFSVPLNGGVVTHLSSHSVIRTPIITADSERVIYKCEGELYSVPSTGGSVVKLNGALVAGGQVGSPNWFGDVQVSPDSSRVVYWADQETDEVFELYSVPAAGGTAVKLNGSLVPGGNTLWEKYGISPDSSRVVYIADQEVDEQFELYSVSLTGGTPIKLNAALPPEGDVDSFTISPDSVSVLYIADQNTDGIFELYQVPMAGGTPSRLNAPLIAGGTVKSCVVSPDSATVVYQADQDTLGIYELYRIPLTGGVAVKLNGTMVAGGCAGVSYIDSLGYSITSNSQRVIYRGDQDADEVFSLYSTPLADGTAVKLNDSLAIGGDVLGFEISPNSKYIVYQSDEEVDGQAELYSVNKSNGVMAKLNSTLVPKGKVAPQWYELLSAYYPGGRGFQITPDSKRVIYRAMQEKIDVYDLYSVSIDGGTSIKLDGPLPEGGTVFDFEISPDSSRVVYLASQDSSSQNELYSVSITGGTSTQLNLALDAGNVLETFLISPDSSRVVYSFREQMQHDLYSVPISGGTAVKITTELLSYSHSFDISRDSSLIVYKGNKNLYSAPIDGGASIKISLNLVSGGAVGGYVLSPDSCRIVYCADQDTDNVTELYSVSILGGFPVKLNAPLVGGGSLIFNYGTYFSVSPDSRRVVYLADQDGDGVFELFSVSIDGGAVTKLSGELASGGDVRDDFIISPDSSHVLYRADQHTAGIIDLYSVPIEGGSIVRLNDEFVSEGYVYSPMMTTADSSQVVYLTNLKRDNVYELHKAPLCGGQAEKLNGDLCAGGTVSRISCTPYPGYSVSPNGLYAVYMANQDKDNRIELYATTVIRREHWSAY